jgi:hypothetical protein
MARGMKDESIDWSKLDPGLSEEGGMKPAPGKVQQHLQNLGNKALAVLKLLLGLTFLAFVYAGSRGFFTKFRLADADLQACFWSGMVAFIITYLFLYEPTIVYQKGQKILAFVFKFFAPLVKVAPYVLPIYSLLVFASYPLLKMWMLPKDAAGLVVFLGGFSWTLHIVFSAKSLRARQGDFLKANYIFSFTLIYILDLLFIAFLLSLIVDKFSFVGFFQSSFEAARDLWVTVTKQVFVLN